MRAWWTVPAAVLAFLHAGLSLVGAVATAALARPGGRMTVGEAQVVAVLIALMAVALMVSAVLALYGRARPVLAAAGVSLAISAYVAVRWWDDESSGWTVPVQFAVLPALVVVVVAAGRWRRGPARS